MSTLSDLEHPFPLKLCAFTHIAGTHADYQCGDCDMQLRLKTPWPQPQVLHPCPHGEQHGPEIPQPSPEEKAAAKHAAKHGPGTQLHKLIEQLTGEGITASCKCARHIAEMNHRGPDWCKKNVETIVGWLLEEVQRRIDKAKADGKPVPWRVQLGGKDLPGRRYAMEKLILKAISRAEAAGASG